MKMGKRLFAGMTAAVLLASTLAGCGGGKDGAPAASGGKAEQTLFLFDLVPFNEDWEVYKKAEEATNIHIKGTLSQSTSDGNTAFSLMLSSGNLADIIHTWKRNDFYKYGKEGVLIPLNDLIDKNAPNIKKFLEGREDVKKYMTAPDGNIYFIPFIPDGDASEGWFIRQDWLDKLNLKTPETVQELYTVLKAFREQDPNGNGKQDEVPYFNRDASANSESGINDLLCFWNGLEKNFQIIDGRVVYGPTRPEFKEAMQELSKWYAEGLIDNEIYTRGNNARDYLLGNDLGGMTHDWFASTADYNNKLKEQIPEMNFVPFAPPAGLDGVKREMARRDRVSECGWGISSQNKDPETAIRWMDYWFTEEGRRLMNFGIEGEDYDMVDGKPVFKDSVLHGDQSVANYLKAKGGQGNVGFHQDFEYERQWTNPIALKGIEAYTQNGYFQEKYPAVILEEDEQDEYDNIMKDIEVLRDETMQKWILGSETVEAGYDAFMENMKKMGIERATEIQQKAVDRYNAE